MDIFELIFHFCDESEKCRHEIFTERDELIRDNALHSVIMEKVMVEKHCARDIFDR